MVGLGLGLGLGLGQELVIELGLVLGLGLALALLGTMVRIGILEGLTIGLVGKSQVVPALVRTVGTGILVGLVSGTC